MQDKRGNDVVKLKQQIATLQEKLHLREELLLNETKEFQEQLAQKEKTIDGLLKKILEVEKLYLEATSIMISNFTVPSDSPTIDSPPLTSSSSTSPSPTSTLSKTKSKMEKTEMETSKSDEQVNEDSLDAGHVRGHHGGGGGRVVDEPPTDQALQRKIPKLNKIKSEGCGKELRKYKTSSTAERPLLLKAGGSPASLSKKNKESSSTSPLNSSRKNDTKTKSPESPRKRDSVNKKGSSRKLTEDNAHDSEEKLPNGLLSSSPSLPSPRPAMEPIPMGVRTFSINLEDGTKKSMLVKDLSETLRSVLEGFCKTRGLPFEQYVPHDTWSGKVVPLSTPLGYIMAVNYVRETAPLGFFDIKPTSEARPIGRNARRSSRAFSRPKGTSEETKLRNEIKKLQLSFQKQQIELEQKEEKIGEQEKKIHQLKSQNNVLKVQLTATQKNLESQSTTPRGGSTSSQALFNRQQQEIKELKKEISRLKRERDQKPHEFRK
eukprot:TRINITY_DN9062_c1_g3_i1.p1 TRINITY_DN9062_c1_g3~~TRINITY_DN9062_c1_g3_i1.p1  ORF type:complete len:547 (-),score=147.41 TRINITY_DN9062_c1_g3_i1:180-1649(-)